MLAKHPNFEAYSCFKRVARAGGPQKQAPPIPSTPDIPVSDVITNMDIYQFLRYWYLILIQYRENKRYYVGEDDCKFIVKYYDSDNDGCINFLE